MPFLLFFGKALVVSAAGWVLIKTGFDEAQEAPEEGSLLDSINDGINHAPEIVKDSSSATKFVATAAGVGALAYMVTPLIKNSTK